MPGTTGGQVSRHGRPCTSVYDLLGQDENDLTAAFGFTLAKSPTLLSALVCRLLPGAEAAQAVIRMETSDELGRTDLEIETPHHLVVVEAKRGWQLPSPAQLLSYVGRVAGHGGGLLVTLSDCSPEWPLATGYPVEVAGVPIRHLPWSEVQADLDEARETARGVERTWLEELHDYLRRAIRVRDPEDSLVYCVVVSRDRPGNGGARDFMDFVVDEGVYFHPFGWGSGWPTTPPNFMAFRWDNLVQRVHRVISHEVIPTLQTRWPDIPAVEGSTDRPHVVYQLGARLRIDPLPTGRNFRANRVAVLLDQLLTCDTLVEAIAGTNALVQGAPTFAG